MDNISIAATLRSPKISFDFTHNKFNISGESYPENVSEFYSPLIKEMEAYLSSVVNADIEFCFELIYFNSSTAKILLELFDMLDEAAHRGNRVDITWTYEVDDDNLKELGQEFGADLQHARFSMQEITL
ncbi:DUF1987 domain-containing protein [Pararhodospirillum oryzae]|uniref:SiaC family regulatory phosphoprotein domain-containing protein n=1 Tax=Pararhodospirillum oryzae TaxID=478448 RepID=A0A512H8Q6_9PROT|nr:DUF1987 domain-containing protein [Pararhodospirillum oryzae]GEO81836.1 hypothetical protein ROR02_19670 [Pararhodospirillum oryzae]